MGGATRSRVSRREGGALPFDALLGNLFSTEENL